jgi:hypothetical protein
MIIGVAAEIKSDASREKKNKTKASPLQPTLSIICYMEVNPGQLQLQANRILFFSFLILVCEAIGTAATPGVLCQPRGIVKMIVEKQMECRLGGETEVLGENLP